MWLGKYEAGMSWRGWCLCVAGVYVWLNVEPCVSPFKASPAPAPCAQHN